MYLINVDGSQERNSGSLQAYGKMFNPSLNKRNAN